MHSYTHTHKLSKTDLVVEDVHELLKAVHLSEGCACVTVDGESLQGFKGQLLDDREL